MVPTFPSPHPIHSRLHVLRIFTPPPIVFFWLSSSALAFMLYSDGRALLRHARPPALLQRPHSPPTVFLADINKNSLFAMTIFSHRKKAYLRR
jgi:hypothetical protein